MAPRKRGYFSNKINTTASTAINNSAKAKLTNRGLLLMPLKKLLALGCFLAQSFCFLIVFSRSSSCRFTCSAFFLASASFCSGVRLSSNKSIARPIPASIIKVQTIKPNVPKISDLVASTPNKIHSISKNAKNLIIRYHNYSTAKYGIIKVILAIAVGIYNVYRGNQKARKNTWREV